MHAAIIPISNTLTGRFQRSGKSFDFKRRFADIYAKLQLTTNDVNRVNEKLERQVRALFFPCRA